MKRYYVYRITNLLLDKHYYGSRTSKKSNPNELGISYFSSSTDEEFIQDQKDNPQNYKYKIIKLFNNTRTTILFESALHTKFNVKQHENFYNKANQTGTSFDFQKTIYCNYCNENIDQGNYKQYHGTYCLNNPNRLDFVNRSKCRYCNISMDLGNLSNHEMYFCNKNNHQKSYTHAPYTKQQIVSCPHCQKEGASGNMKRYHFNNCIKK